MPKIIIDQTNFNAGELSPELYGHVNLDRYKTGLKIARNAVLSPRGPAKKRNGTAFIAESRNSTKKSRLIRFQYNQEFAYIIEMTEGYLRFYRNGAIIGDPILEIESPYLESELFEVTYVQFANTLYFAHSNHPPLELVWGGDDEAWDFWERDFYPPATKEEGYKPAATLTPSATTGSSVTFTASAASFVGADVGRQIHNLVGDGIASITSVTSSTVVANILEDFPSTSAIAAGDWKMDLSPIAKLTFTGTSQGSVTLVESKYIDSAKGDPKTVSGITKATPAVVTANGHGFSNGDNIIITGVVGMTQVNDRIYAIDGVTTNTFTLQNPDTGGAIDSSNFAAYISGGRVRKVLKDVDLGAFRAADVGTYILANDGVMKIVEYISPTQVRVEIQKDMSSADDTSAWSQETPAWNAANGYPKTVGLHQQRIWYGGTKADPQTIWASEVGIFDGMGTGSEDTAALNLDISAQEVNQITWMASTGQSMAIGTIGSEITISSGSTTAPISPSNATQETRSSEGATVQQPVVLGSEILYLQRSKKKINSFRYDFSTDGFKNNDLLFLANHVSDVGIVEVAVANDPDKAIYAVNTDGTMSVGTYMADQEVLGWARWSTQGKFESVATISTGDHDEVWVVVNRTIGGTTKRYIERLDFSTGENSLDIFSDSCMSFGTPKTPCGVPGSGILSLIYSPNHGLNTGDRVLISGRIYTGPPLSSLSPKYKGINGLLTDNKDELLNCAAIFDVVANVGEMGPDPDTFYISGFDPSFWDVLDTPGYWQKVTDVITGLDHLEGMTVQVKADGAYHPDRTVTAGAILLQKECAEVTVGLQYDFKITLLPHEFDVGAGSMQGQPQRWVKPQLRLLKSAFPLINGEKYPARNPTMQMDVKVPLFTGNAAYGSFTWQEGTDLTITSSLPLPCVILAVTGSIDSGMI